MNYPQHSFENVQLNDDTKPTIIYSYLNIYTILKVQIVTVHREGSCQSVTSSQMPGICGFTNLHNTGVIILKEENAAVQLKI